MTATIAQTVANTRERRASRPRTFAGALSAACLAAASVANVLVWPSTVYQGRPGDFAREVLGLHLLREQEDVLIALDQPNARVSWTGSHKLGKDFSAAAFVWYFVCTYPGARVQITAPSDKQVNEITWREIKMRARTARVPVCDPLDMGDLARTGYVATDFREIKGHTSKTAEAVAGISGPHVLYVVTEASGMADAVMNAIEGNLAGRDARILLLFNPTKSSGYAFDTHHEPADREPKQWKTFQYSAELIAAAQEREGVELPGLATRRWIANRLEAWGKDDSRYKVRVLGEFVESEEDKVFSLELVTEAQRRWESTPIAPSDPLHVGIDPAYGGRDEIAVALRRGRKILAVRRFQEPNTARAAEVIAGYIGAELRPHEDGCVVRVDRGGENGWKFVRCVSAAMRDLDPLGQRISVRGVSFGDPVRRAAQFVRFRDELWFTLREWMRDGGAIPSDDKLEDDVLAPKLTQHDNGKVSVEPKESIKKRLGRSTDSADACILSVWSHADTRDEQGPEPPELPASVSDSHTPAGNIHDAMRILRGGR